MVLVFVKVSSTNTTRDRNILCFVFEESKSKTNYPSASKNKRRLLTLSFPGWQKQTLPRNSQVQPGAARRRQEQPGAAWSSQEQPGVARVAEHRYPQKRYKDKRNENTMVCCLIQSSSFVHVTDEKNNHKYLFVYSRKWNPKLSIKFVQQLKTHFQQQPGAARIREVRVKPWTIYRGCPCKCREGIPIYIYIYISDTPM